MTGFRLSKMSKIKFRSTSNSLDGEKSSDIRVDILRRRSEAFKILKNVRVLSRSLLLFYDVSVSYVYPFGLCLYEQSAALSDLNFHTKNDKQSMCLFRK